MYRLRINRRIDTYAEMGVAMISALVSFAVSLFVGGLAIYIGGRIVSDTDDYGRVVVTALLGVIAWIAALLIVSVLRYGAVGVPGA